MDHQAPDPSTRRHALRELSPFVGTWHGSGWTSTPHGRTEFEQTEHVAYTMGGELLTVEGTGNQPGTPDDVRFRAFAVVRFDEESGEFKWRAYSSGNSIEVPLEITDTGYRWGFDIRPGLRMRFDITLDAATWSETGQISGDDGASWEPSLEMRLSRA